VNRGSGIRERDQGPDLGGANGIGFFGNGFWSKVYIFVLFSLGRRSCKRQKINRLDVKLFKNIELLGEFGDLHPF
jgi:hypothetical protein